MTELYLFLQSGAKTNLVKISNMKLKVMLKLFILLTLSCSCVSTKRDLQVDERKDGSTLIKPRGGNLFIEYDSRNPDLLIIGSSVDKKKNIYVSGDKYGLRSIQIVNFKDKIEEHNASDLLTGVILYPGKKNNERVTGARAAVFNVGRIPTPSE